MVIIMQKRDFPILEFDATSKAIIEPEEQVTPLDVPEYRVLTFFGEVLDKLEAQRKAKIITTHRWADKDRHLFELELQGKRFAAIHPGVGASLTCGILEEIIARGCRNIHRLWWSAVFWIMISLWAV